MRKACHNILYVVANSNALEHARVGVPGWIYGYVAFDAVMLGLIALGFMGCTKKKKVKVKKRNVKYIESIIEDKRAILFLYL